jgi:hypothetical protein
MKLRTIVAIATMASVPVLAAAGPALAADNAQGSIYANNHSCGGADDTSQPVQGFMIVHQSGSSLHLNIHLQGAAPDATYYFYLYQDSSCLGPLVAKIVTNHNGVGNANVDATLSSPADTSVYVFGASVSGLVESVAVTP